MLSIFKVSKFYWKWLQNIKTKYQIKIIAHDLNFLMNINPLFNFLLSHTYLQFFIYAFSCLFVCFSLKFLSIPIDVSLAMPSFYHSLAKFFQNFLSIVSFYMLPSLCHLFAKFFQSFLLVGTCSTPKLCHFLQSSFKTSFPLLLLVWHQLSLDLCNYKPSSSSFFCYEIVEIINSFHIYIMLCRNICTCFHVNNDMMELMGDFWEFEFCSLLFIVVHWNFCSLQLLFNGTFTF